MLFNFHPLFHFPPIFFCKLLVLSLSSCLSVFYPFFGAMLLPVTQSSRLLTLSPYCLISFFSWQYLKISPQTNMVCRAAEVEHRSAPRKWPPALVPSVCLVRCSPHVTAVSELPFLLCTKCSLAQVPAGLSRNLQKTTSAVLKLWSHHRGQNFWSLKFRSDQCYNLTSRALMIPSVFILDLMFTEVFSSLNNSMILWFLKPTVAITSFTPTLQLCSCCPLLACCKGCELQSPCEKFTKLKTYKWSIFVA